MLFFVVIAAGASSVALAIAGRRHGGRSAPVLECVMLMAMVDTHLPTLGVVPVPLWSLLLVGCAIGGAFAARLRAGGRSHAAIAQLHAAGMLLAAVLLLLIGTASNHAARIAQPIASGVAHAHGHGDSSALPAMAFVGIAVIGYAAAVVTVLLRRRPDRVEAARCLSSLAGVAAMAVMAAAPALH
jgi:hypothetical protein